MMILPDGSWVFWPGTTGSYTIGAVTGPIPMGRCPVCRDRAPQNSTCPNARPNSCGGPAACCPWCAIAEPIV